MGLLRSLRRPWKPLGELLDRVWSKSLGDEPAKPSVVRGVHHDEGWRKTELTDLVFDGREPLRRRKDLRLSKRVEDVVG